TITLAVVSLGAMALILLESVRRFQADYVRSQVDALANASAEGQPYVIYSLDPYRGLAVPLLQERFQNDSQDFLKRFRLACALAELDEPPAEFLAEAVGRLPASPAECRNVTHALKPGGEGAFLLRNSFHHERDPVRRFRQAVVLLHLGYADAAR